MLNKAKIYFFIVTLLSATFAFADHSMALQSKNVGVEFLVCNYNSESITVFPTDLNGNLTPYQLTSPVTIQSSHCQSLPLANRRKTDNITNTIINFASASGNGYFVISSVSQQLIKSFGLYTGDIDKTLVLGANNSLPATLPLYINYKDYETRNARTSYLVDVVNTNLSNMFSGAYYDFALCFYNDGNNPRNSYECPTKLN